MIRACSAPAICIVLIIPPALPAYTGPISGRDIGSDIKIGAIEPRTNPFSARSTIVRELKGITHDA